MDPQLREEYLMGQRSESTTAVTVNGVTGGPTHGFEGLCMECLVRRRSTIDGVLGGPTGGAARLSMDGLPGGWDGREGMSVG